MIWKVTAERIRDGRQLRLTGNEDNFQLTEVTGLSVPQASIYTYDTAALDGVRAHNIKESQRDITLTLALREGTASLQDVRLSLYNLFTIRDVIRLHFETRSRRVYIDGYVESIECSHYANPQTMEISILCPSPYFLDEETLRTSLSKTTGLFEFPFSISADAPVEISSIETTRSSEIDVSTENETGGNFTLSFDIDANTFYIMQEETKEFMLFDLTNAYLDGANRGIRAGDKVTICTISGQKSATLLRDNTEYNILAYMNLSSTWFQFANGVNTFNYMIDGVTTITTVDLVVEYTPVYLGI